MTINEYQTLAMTTLNPELARKDVLINSVKNVDKEFYLVNADDRQFLVMVTDEFIESRQLAEKVLGNSFVIGDFKFTVCKKTISFKED